MAAPVSETAFQYVHHLVTVPVVVNALPATFALDTGIGLTLLSSRLARAVGCEPRGETFTGRRMSGQQVEVPLAPAPSIQLGGLEQRHGVVGVLDLGESEGELGGIDGLLSLGHFETTPFTVDYPRRTLVLESTSSLAERDDGGIGVGVRLERDGPSVAAFLPMRLPGGGRVEAEVDMGSDALILDARVAAEVGVQLDDPSVRRLEGEDETGHRYTRYFARLDGVVSVADAPRISQDRPTAMFQPIVHEALVGNSFLRRWVVTYDLPNARMIFA